MYSHLPPDMVGGKSMESFYEYVQTDEIRKKFGEELVQKALKLTVGLQIGVMNKAMM
jgi:hypothetical protein